MNNETLLSATNTQAEPMAQPEAQMPPVQSQSGEKPKTQIAVPHEIPFEETPILPIDEHRSVQTDFDAARDDLLDLRESQQSGRILTGTLMGIEKPENTSGIVAVIYHGTYKIIIPLQEAIIPPDDYNGYPPERVHAYLLNKRLGSEVDFVVKGIDSHSKVAIASRLEAMRIKRKRYYFAKDREGNDLIHIGTRAEARVTASIRHGIYVELFGMETFIHLTEISYQRLSDARQLYQPGQRVLVKVTELDKSDRDNIQLSLSVKQAKENPAKQAFGRFAVGNMYMGTVSMIRPNGIYVSMEGGIDCLCKLTNRTRPPKDTRVTVRILGKDESKYALWGVITYIAGIN